MKDREAYWADAAKTLRGLLNLMPDVKPETLRTMKPEDVQSMIQSWKPAEGASYERSEALRVQMASMEPKAFASVYEEMLAGLDKQAGNA